jgi:hypothetical protein
MKSLLAILIAIILIALISGIHKSKHIESDPCSYDWEEEFDSYEECVDWMDETNTQYDYDEEDEGCD